MKIKDYVLNKPTLETELLILRQMTVEDVPDLREWLSDPDLYTYWGRPIRDKELNPELLFEVTRPNIKRKPSKDFHWGIILNETNKVIGEIWVLKIDNDRMAQVAYRVSKTYWNKGLTTEALHRVIKFCFEDTELQRLWTDVDARNIASCKLLEKCGFQKEGFIRQGKFNLTFCDYYLYGMLKDDYRRK
jgi:ribosomal-protein-alanine N-acetyltransferase